MDYRIVRFFRHPKIDRKVMHIEVADEERPSESLVREFYWEPPGYRNRSDDSLVEEVRRLLGLAPDYPMECPAYDEAP